MPTEGWDIFCSDLLDYNDHAKVCACWPPLIFYHIGYIWSWYCYCLHYIKKLLNLQEMAILIALFKILVVLFSVVLHEVSHAVMANSMGDNTAKDSGRITLNPLKHLDWFGSVLLPLITYWAGGFVFGYAKPVPYNPNNLSDKKYGPAKVALAGPAVNLTIAVLVGLVLRFLPSTLSASLLPELLSFIVVLNLVLAIFNLVPIPPLDGHWLLLTLLPNRFAAFKLFLVRYSMFLFFVFLFFVFPLIYPLINILFRIIVG